MKNEERIVKIGGFLLTLIGCAVTCTIFYTNGITQAKEHAEVKVNELKKEISAQMQKIENKVEMTGVRIEKIDQSVVRIETILNERLGEKRR